MFKIINDSMLNLNKYIEPNSIDSIVTDPPYELNFMGKGWDNAGVSFNKDTWKKCFEVLKPGGYLLAFGGSRTFHRIACAIEDAGFEIRDCIMWIYGSGFPKSMDISKQIDKRPNKTYEAKIKFGELIKEYRNNKNLTQRQLGELIGVSRELINLYEIKGNYQQQIPTKEQWNKIKEVLNITNNMDYIYEEAEREVIGTKKNVGCFNNDSHYTVGGTKANDIDITAPSTNLAKQWNGWGTCLKPAFEPIIVARKPFKGSLVDNVLEYGVGGLNIDECRVELQENETIAKNIDFKAEKQSDGWGTKKCITEQSNQGRFPANLILTYDETDFEEVCGGFPDTKSQKRDSKYNKETEYTNTYTPVKSDYRDDNTYNDSGSAARYFYCAKASKKDRDEGLEDFKNVSGASITGRKENSAGLVMEGGKQNPFAGKASPNNKNIHPTVKPTSLMQYLVRLVTPKGGTVLDPFMGSGSTGKAAMYENNEREANYKFVGIELSEEYCNIARARIAYVNHLQFEEIYREIIESNLFTNEEIEYLKTLSLEELKNLLSNDFTNN